MTTALFIPSDDRQSVAPFARRVPADLSALVGDMMEAVDLPTLGVTVYVDESGLVKRLPFNSRATFLWWHHGRTSREAILVGDAVVVGMPDDNGDDADVPPRAMRLLTADLRFVTEVRSASGVWLRPSEETGSYWDALVWSTVLMQAWPAAAETRIVEV